MKKKLDIRSELKVYNLNFKIHVDDYIKICNFEERFWCNVKEIYNNFIVARIENYLVDNTKYDFGDLILIEKKHVFNVIHFDSDED